MEILAVPVGGLADPDAPPAAEHALDLGDEMLGCLEIFRFSKLPIQRDQQHQAEGISPEIAQAIGPDPTLAHPVELLQHIAGVLQHRPPPGA
jgi:hypothetical protein